MTHEFSEARKEQLEREKRAEKGLIGVGLLKLFTHEGKDAERKIVFGSYNPRAVEPKSVKRMVEQFMSKECSSRQFPLRCIVSAGDVKNAAELIKDYDGKTVETSTRIPSIEWNERAQSQPLVMLAGQHRVAAARQAWPKLQEVRREMESKLEDLTTELEDAAHASSESEEIRAEMKAVEEGIQSFRVYMDLVQRWPVEVYDEGE
jgi:hypothetical protein